MTARKIVVLDCGLIGPDPDQWAPLRQWGELSIYQRISPEEVVARAKEAEVLILQKTPLSAETLAQLPRLRYVCILLTGYDHVDLKAARRLKILVTNLPSYSTDATAQHTIALLLEVTNRVGEHNRFTQQGQWCRSPDFSLPDVRHVPLDGKILGIIGFGAIGHKVAKMARGLGMRVVATAGKGKGRGVERVGQEDLLQMSDVVSLHCNLTEETRHLINASALRLFKPSAILINTARGGLIDERALAEALKDKRLRAAALDVLDREPPTPDCPLLGLDNCLITPHIAWAAEGIRERCLEQAFLHVEAYVNGAPLDPVRDPQ
jgi:glycerate dehydrogenase